MEPFKVIKDALRVIFFTIDQAVYGLIPSIYNLIISLANVDLYNNNFAIAALLNRVYIIVGIFMLFKLAFAILRYIVDPSAFSDSAKGFTGLVKRILIAIILLVSIPFVFGKIYDYQEKILNSQVIPNLILGTKDNGTDDYKTAAVDLQFMIFSPFYSLNTANGEFNVCATDPNNPNDRPLSNLIGSTDMALKDGCLDAFAKAMDADSTIKASGVTIDKFWKTDSGDSRDFAAFGSLLSWSLGNGEYAINYIPIISTICGGYLAFLLLSFCIDIAVRAIKLVLLQILSPIAIISSVDPTSSSQNDKLKDWGMECLKTYISLFLRLAVIYVIIQVIKVITAKLFAGPDSLYYSGFVSKADPNLNIWIYIFLVLGAFAVAKKIPELIEKAFGIKMSGEISMNPFKTFRENLGTSLVGVGAAAIGGGLVNTAVSGYQAFANSREDGHGRLWAAGSAIRHGLGSGIAGTSSVLNRGVRGAMRGDRGFKNMRNAYGSAMFARQQRADLHRQGVSYADIYKADLQRNLGIFTDAQQQQFDYDSAMKELQGRQNDFEERKRQAEYRKANATRDYSEYQNTMSKIETLISNRAAVSKAEKALQDAQASGDSRSIKAARDYVDRVKNEEFNKMMRDSNDADYRMLKSYQSTIQELRNNNSTTIGSYADYYTVNSSGEYEFDKSSMYSAQKQKDYIEESFARGVEKDFAFEEQMLANEKAKLESKKNDPQWAINEKANSASRVNSPQPEGWMPTGEIQGQYRDTFGPSGWGGGPGGPRPGGPGPGPRP